MKAKAKKKTTATRRPKTEVPTPKYFTVGVRFMSANVGKVYTYRVDRKHRVHHGDLLVADTPTGAAVVAVVRVDTVNQDNNFGVDYRYITKKVADL